MRGSDGAVAGRVVEKWKVDSRRRWIRKLENPGNVKIERRGFLLASLLLAVLYGWFVLADVVFHLGHCCHRKKLLHVWVEIQITVGWHTKMFLLM